MKITLLFTLVLFSFNTIACRCYPNYASKKYQDIDENWYGKKFRYSCLYECESGGFKEVISAHHKKIIIGKERGNEVVCDGTIYKEQYMPARGWFIWYYYGSQWFNPKKSKSTELKDWAARHCR